MIGMVSVYHFGAIPFAKTLEFLRRFSEIYFGRIVVFKICVYTNPY